MLANVAQKVGQRDRGQPGGVVQEERLRFASARREVKKAGKLLSYSLDVGVQLLLGL